MDASLGVTINGKHTLKDWDLHWSQCEISEPVPIASYVEIPGRKTRLDATESLLGSVTYENRTLTFGFWSLGSWAKWMQMMSRIQTAIAGKLCKVTLDTEPDVFWMGRARVSGTKTADNSRIHFMTIVIDAEPYKYWEERPSGTDWLWDPFSFQDGVIQNLQNISVNGSKTQAVVGKSRPAIPTVIATADMTCSVAGKSYQLTANEPKTLEDVLLYRGTTNFSFTGTGKVSIIFRGETL